MKCLGLFVRWQMRRHEVCEYRYMFLVVMFQVYILACFVVLISFIAEHRL